MKQRPDGHLYCSSTFDFLAAVRNLKLRLPIVRLGRQISFKTISKFQPDPYSLFFNSIKANGDSIFDRKDRADIKIGPAILFLRQPVDFGDFFRNECCGVFG